MIFATIGQTGAIQKFTLRANELSLLRFSKLNGENVESPTAVRKHKMTTGNFIKIFNGACSKIIGKGVTNNVGAN